MGDKAPKDLNLAVKYSSWYMILSSNYDLKGFLYFGKGEIILYFVGVKLGIHNEEVSYKVFKCVKKF